MDNYLALRTIPSHIIKVSKKEMPELKCSKIIHFLSKFLLKIFRPINIINSEWQMTFTCCQKKTESTLHVRESRTGENFCLWNPESWALESGIQLKESRTHLTTGIHKDWNPILYSGIHAVGSRIHDCLRFPIHGTRKWTDNDHIETGDNC